tara:strand:- start:215 stop:898 length:684 start_codon:yes stop_codon:yes gene_type:complete
MSAKQTRTDRTVVKFNNKTYQKYSDRPYYERVGGRYFLHRDVWAFYNGEIPIDHHIHHIDGDTSNNTIANLQCLPAKEHRLEHREDKSVRGKSKESLEHLAKIRPLTVAWHQSKEGRAWHSEHAKKFLCGENKPVAYSKVIPVEKVCIVCNESFVSKNPNSQEYCSNKCVSKAMRLRNKVDKPIVYFDKKCEHCNNDIHTIYGYKRFCNSVCKNGFNRAKRKHEASI